MIGCFKQGLLVHPSRSMEDNGAESDEDYRDPNGAESDMDYRVPDGGGSERKDISNWPRYHSYNIFVKNVAAFCPCPKILPEAKLKSWINGVNRDFPTL